MELIQGEVEGTQLKKEGRLFGSVELLKHLRYQCTFTYRFQAIILQYFINKGNEHCCLDKIPNKSGR